MQLGFGIAAAHIIFSFKIIILQSLETNSVKNYSDDIDRAFHGQSYFLTSLASAQVHRKVTIGRIISSAVSDFAEARGFY